MLRCAQFSGNLRLHEAVEHDLRRGIAGELLSHRVCGCLGEISQIADADAGGRQDAGHRPAALRGVRVEGTLKPEIELLERDDPFRLLSGCRLS